jgi:hypothetical protein
MPGGEMTAGGIDVRIRPHLANWAVSAEVAGFVVRWANREFSLVAED